MDITWIIVIAAVGLVAVAGTVFTLLRERAPRVAADTELVARMRDQVADREARLLSEQVAERVAEERHARGRAPQRTHAAGTERLWAGGL
ncbi:hypothetical protein [Agrococcus sp. ARC_14]|uniref:hypothetical protein n=1 Tax=Agrococcus sp. ARC_14 TaxID=2919927 RepID=UPI001F05BE6D|nr:hypothetical protein [Agrococcus sp. ARC_14]MCH1884070.1 hypothetical protein [Agrococcus sp. ARC_14]